MPETAIEWATHVWNPFTGCDIVSAGCGHCYAKEFAASLKRREQGRVDKALAEGRPAPKVRYQNDGDPKTSGPGFGFTVHEDKLASPEHFPAGARVFVNSMSDVFHEEASDIDIARVFGAAAAQPWANFLILTKRPERMHELLNHPEFVATTMRASGQVGLDWPLPSVWLGVSIEKRDFVHRADLLRETPAAVRFISAEPLLGPLVHPTACTCIWRLVRQGEERRTVDPDCPEHGSTSPSWDALGLADIDWLIVGGESGKGHRRIDPQWVRDLRDACTTEIARRARHDLPGRCNPGFFFKQWGGRRAKDGGRELDGRTWSEFPNVAGRSQS